ncbi:MAG TPA: CDP-glycerol glycerophosphotransferase family protein [Candidatus Limnocylindria bacterium]|nr:CDP-glycerol glycerophosphotransferase family protein [Candidatus Limnocylindria bacterium]
MIAPEDLRGRLPLVDAAPDRKRADRPTIEIETLAWERIQLVVRARILPGLAVDPATVRLEPDDHVGPAMRPTHASREGDDLYLRFNVMQGPGQEPLAAGRWELISLATEGVPRASRASGMPRMSGVAIGVANGRALDPYAHAREFALSRGSYRVEPAIDPFDATFVLDVRLSRSRLFGSRMPWGGILARLRQLTRLRELRRRGFALLYHLNGALHRRDGSRILFTSDSHEQLSGNLKVIHDRMVERGLDRDHRLLTLFKPSVAAPRTWRDRFRMPRLLASADVILLDDYQPVIYRIEPARGVRIIQLWHASGAFKTVGYSRVGKPGGPSPWSRTHKNYTRAIVSSDFDVPFYAEAFGIPERRVVPTGIPRMDRFFDERASASARQEALSAFPEIAGRRTFLLAPTFRGKGPRDAYYDVDLVDVAALHQLAVEKDAVVIVKLHPFVRQPLSIPQQFADRIVDGSRSSIDVNDLLFAVDVLITDYSSIVFEYSTLGRPMLFFAYDLEDYVATRDFYVPFEEFVPGRIVRTFDELLDAMRRDDYQAEKVAAFAARHFSHLDGGSTDRVIDQLILAR